MRMPITAALAAIAGLLASPGIAAGAGADPEPCAADIARYCARLPVLEVLGCLQGNRNNLAPACVDRLEAVLVNLQLARQDCTPDAFAYCRDVGPGRPMMRCLGQHQGELSRRCQQVFDGWARREREVQGPCAADASVLCRDAPPGRGQLYACLLSEVRRLTPGCRDALTSGR